MHIGFIVTGDPEAVTGGNVYNTYLIDYLKKTGHRVDLIIIPQRNYLGHVWQNITGSNLNTHSFRKYDMILEDMLAHPALWNLNIRLAKKFSLPLVAIVHAFRSVMRRRSMFRWLYRIIESRFLNSVDGIIYNSHFSREVENEKLFNSKPSIVAYPGRDRFDPELTVGKNETSEPGLRLIFVGNVHKGKGLHTLLHALKKIGDEKITLEIVGSLQFEPKYARRLQHEVRQHDLQDQVTFHGSQTEVELTQHYRNADALVVPSDSESFGMVYLEGFAFGLPALASDVGGAREIVRHGENGFLISPGDINALADHIKQLRSDKDLLTMMSINAKETYKSHPTWKESLNKIHEFLFEIVSNE